MAVLRRPLPRFFLWLVFIVIVASVAAVNNLDWWLILLVVFGAWAIGTLVERTLWRHSIAPRGDSAPPPAPVVEREPEPQSERAPEPEPMPVAPAVLVPAAVEAAPMPPPMPVAPEPARRRAIRPRPGALRSPVRWNVWSLEKLADQHPEHEELGFLVLSLRDFASADGQLPADFDPLVRESFGDLLPG